MIRPLNKAERAAHRAEHPTMAAAYRVGIALDRENQPDPERRQRVVCVRAYEAAPLTVGGRRITL